MLSHHEVRTVLAGPGPGPVARCHECADRAAAAAATVTAAAARPWSLKSIMMAAAILALA
jgi:hypothetical protein